GRGHRAALDADPAGARGAAAARRRHAQRRDRPAPAHRRGDRARTHPQRNAQARRGHAHGSCGDGPAAADHRITATLEAVLARLPRPWRIAVDWALTIAGAVLFVLVFE